MAELRDRPIFICGHPKSGTSLLRGVLDSHPQVITYPEETAFFRRYLPQAQGKSVEEKLALSDRFITHIFEWNAANPPDHQKNYPGRDYSYIPVDTVRAELRKLIAERFNHEGDMLSAAMLAFGKVTGKWTDVSLHWAEKTPFNEHYVKQIFIWWPEALCIHVVRDPRDNFASYRRKQATWTAHQFAASWRRSTRAGMKNQKRYGEKKYMLIRYEDFTREPETVIKSLCAFMGISDNASMLTPKRGGRSWEGNSMFDEKFDTISSTPVGRWKDSLTSEELITLETIDRPQMNALGYALSDSKLGDLPFISRLKVIQNSILINLKETVYG
jgi:hypothetical protein